MSDLVERLRFGGNHKSEATRHEAADRIELLEAALRCHMAAVKPHLDRIEALEAALREIANWPPSTKYARDLAREALAPEPEK